MARTKIKSKLRLVCAFAALASLALAVSCRGFFVKPTLTSLAIGPVSPTIYTGTIDNTIQMFAVGTFDDGSSSSTPVSWTISGTGTSGQTIATISSGGLVTAQDVGTGTITATSNLLPSISGTQTLTVSVACTDTPVIVATDGETLDTEFPTLYFTASCNGGQDITAVGTWVSSNTTIATVSQGIVSALQNANGTFNLTVSSNGFTSNAVSITATGFTTADRRSPK
jgi:hypothetical protein